MPETIAPPVAPPPTGLANPAFLSTLDAMFPEEAPSKPAEPKAEPPPAVAEVKTEPKPEVADPKSWDTDTPPEDIKSEKGQQSWKHQRAAMKELRAEREKLTAEVTTFKKEMEAIKSEASKQKVNVDDLPEYQAIKNERERLSKELETYSERLRLVDVEKHPRFEQYFSAKTQQAMEQAKKYGGDAAVELLRLPESDYRTEKLEELAGSLGTVRGGLLINAMSSMDAINAERASEIAKAKESYKAIKDAEVVKEQQHKESLSKAFQSVRGEVVEKLPVFQMRENDPEWNKGVTERLALAEQIYQGQMEPQAIARAAAWSAAAPAFLAELNGANSRIKEMETAHAGKVAELEAQITKLRGSTAKIGDDNRTDTVKEAPGTFNSWVDKIAADSGLK